MQLTNSEKYELIEIDLEELCNEIKREILTRELYLLNKREMYKRQSIDIKMFLELLIDAFDFSVGNKGTKIGVILKVLFKTCFDVLDDDIALVYSYLSNEYFINGIKISNVEIYDKVNKRLGLNWSTDKINKILLQLENMRVIEFVDGVLKVKDKIYFE